VRVLANLAYYRSGWNENGRRFSGEPYRTFNANCFEHVYLDWSKLFGNHDEKHHWRKVVTDQRHFKEGLLAALDCDEAAYREFWGQMLAVRNQVVAHQDIFVEIPTPMLDSALQSVSYFLNYIYENEVGEGIRIEHRYEPNDTYEMFQRWGATFWNGDEPTPEEKRLLSLRTVRLDPNLN
jgi:hypothetical protein